MRWQGGEEPDEQANKPVWMQNENGDAREAQTPTAVQFAPPISVKQSSLAPELYVMVSKSLSEELCACAGRGGAR